MPDGPIILALNGGSSSIRFAVYQMGAVLERRLNGKLDRIGRSHPRLSVTGINGEGQEFPCNAATDYPSAAKALLNWLDTQTISATISAVGHRLVHGMSHTAPEVVTPMLMDELQGYAWIDPQHLPGEIDLIDAFRSRTPALPQVVCFDTAFHSHMPRVATQLAIPRRLESKGLRRYGFHGLSYTYLLEEIARLGSVNAAQGRIILAHLGNGASMAAVHRGQSIDTSMGLTPASGLPMGTRSGDVDPGLALFLERAGQMTSQAVNNMLNYESGLFGLSETSSDMSDLLERESSDFRAAEAVALFCYQAKKWLGAYAAALGGLDTLVFAGGIGENAPVVRARICKGLEFLGIELDASRNAVNAAIISSETSPVLVRVIRSDEELMIARSVCRVLGYGL